jgi:hypothetical protein
VSAITDDIVALGRLLAAYADVVNRRAWPELAELFRPDCAVLLDVVTSPARSLTGPAELGRFIGTAIERYDHFEFVVLNSVFDVDGDAAAGRMFMCEIRHDASTGQWGTAYGLYQDRYARVGDRWWFAERRYRSLARRGPDEIVLGLPPELPPVVRGPHR